MHAGLMETIVAFGAGIVAGLGVAAPLGAVGILLLQEGMAWGYRAAAPAAAAVASVDAAYCILALVLGAAAAPAIAALGPWPALLGGAVLLVLGGLGLARTFKGTQASNGGKAPQAAGRTRRFLAFAALTAINPTTLIYFIALTAGLGGHTSSWVASAAFVAGVALASLAWQSGLVLAGGLFSGRLGAGASRWAGGIGHGSVVLLGIAAMAAGLAGWGR